MFQGFLRRCLRKELLCGPRIFAFGRFLVQTSILKQIILTEIIRGFLRLIQANSVTEFTSESLLFPSMCFLIHNSSTELLLKLYTLQDIASFVDYVRKQIINYYYYYYYYTIWMSLVTGLFLLVLLLNKRWSLPLTLQASHCSTFRIMCDVISIAVPNPLVRSIGIYSLADLHHQYKKHIHKRPKHILF